MEKHRISEDRIANPEGTTVNLFDYWVTVSPDENAIDFRDDNPTAGINANHALKFRDAVEAEYAKWGTANYWVGHYHGQNALPCFGMVNRVLGSDGFPVLSGDGYDPDLFKIEPNETESLAYLFNGNDEDSGIANKRAYTDVKGLLQVNDDGYYYYM